MRKELARETGLRKKFRAVFIRVGKKTGFNGFSEETILLKNIEDAESNVKVADHIWFSYTKGFEKLILTEGTLLEFEARITEYRKGYVNARYKINNSTVDYKLSNPTKIKRIEGSKE